MPIEGNGEISRPRCPRIDSDGTGASSAGPGACTHLEYRRRRVALPASPARVARKGSATYRVHDGRVREHPILVVDDEPMVRDVLARYLAREGFAVDVAADGEALERYEEDRPDLVLLDLMLPSIDGYEVFRRMREPRRRR